MRKKNEVVETNKPQVVEGKPFIIKSPALYQKEVEKAADVKFVPITEPNAEYINGLALTYAGYAHNPSSCIPLVYSDNGDITEVDNMIRKQNPGYYDRSYKNSRMENFFNLFGMRARDIARKTMTELVSLLFSKIEEELVPKQEYVSILAKYINIDTLANEETKLLLPMIDNIDISTDEYWDNDSSDDIYVLDFIYNTEPLIIFSV